ALATAGVPALAAQLDLVAGLLTVFAAILSERSAFFDHAAATGVGARGRRRICHDEPPLVELPEYYAVAEPSRGPPAHRRVGRPEWSTNVNIAACSPARNGGC